MKSKLEKCHCWDQWIGSSGIRAVRLKNMVDWSGGKRANATSSQVLNFNRDTLVDTLLSGSCLTLPPTLGAHVASQRPSGSSEKKPGVPGTFFLFTAKLSEEYITFYLNFISKPILFWELNFSNLVILHSPVLWCFKDSFLVAYTTLPLQYSKYVKHGINAAIITT